MTMVDTPVTMATTAEGVKVQNKTNGTESEKEVNFVDPSEMDPQDQPNEQARLRSIAIQGDSDDDAASSDSDGDHNEHVHVPLPLIPLSQGLERKATPYELQSWVSLALTLDGRDKITKVLQYSARFLSWYLAGNHHNHSLRFKALRMSLTTSRKAFRLGRSLIEMHRLRTMGLPDTLRYYLARSLSPEGRIDDDAGVDSTTPSSQRMERDGHTATVATASDSGRALYQSLLRRMQSLVSSKDKSSSLNTFSTPPDKPLLIVIGTALKMIGLLGFWTGDNVAFLTQSGLFDNYAAPTETRMRQRKQQQTRASLFANRCYFMGAVAGLVATLRSYMSFRLTRLRHLQREIEDAEDEEAAARSWKELDKAKEKQFVLFVAFFKSCCDVLVFSNNAGVDLWRKRYGRPMHEGFHCVCGLLSASTVLYNNFPNDPTKSTV